MNIRTIKRDHITYKGRPVIIDTAYYTIDKTAGCVLFAESLLLLHSLR